MALSRLVSVKIVLEFPTRGYGFFSFYNQPMATTCTVQGKELASHHAHTADQMASYSSEIFGNLRLCKMKASPVQKLGPHATAEFHSIYKAFVTVFPKNSMFTVGRVEKQPGSNIACRKSLKKSAKE